MRVWYNVSRGTNRVSKALKEEMGTDKFNEYIDKMLFIEISKHLKRLGVNFFERKPLENCPKCKEGQLIHRNGSKGEFLGCSNYPKCKYTKNIE